MPLSIHLLTPNHILLYTPGTYLALKIEVLQGVGTVTRLGNSRTVPLSSTILMPEVPNGQQLCLLEYCSAIKGRSPGAITPPPRRACRQILPEDGNVIMGRTLLKLRLRRMLRRKQAKEDDRETGKRPAFSSSKITSVYSTRMVLL